MSNDKLKYYSHAMAIDAETGKPMEKVAAQLTGSRVEEQLTDANAVTGTLTFAEPIQFIGIYNRDTVDGVFNVNGINLTIPAGESADFHVGGTASNQVSVSGSTSYIVTRYV
jgi:hypothetical protein